MIFKETLLVPADKSGIWLTKCIHTFSKLSRYVRANSFGKLSVRVTNTGSWAFRKKKRKFLYIRPAVGGLKAGGFIKTHRSVLALKKRLTPLGRRVTGFVSKAVTRKKAISSFVTII